VHAAPAVPHSEAEGVVQTLPLQHPFAHDVALHSHLPPTHCCPAAHAGPVPQAHMPFEHESASCMLHAMHAAPPVPHAATVGGLVHVLPEQQPVAHDVALHTHLPPTHAWPVAQAGLEPQVHAPLVHESACWGLHATPPVPHALVDGVVQVPAWQHPLGHVVESHETTWTCAVASSSADGAVPMTMNVTGDAVTGALVDVSVSVELPPAVTVGGLNEPVTPAGRSCTPSVTVSAVPFVSVVVTAYVTLPVWPIVCDDGLRPIEKSFAAQLGNVTLATYVSHARGAFVLKTSFVYQNVQSSVGSTVMSE
jgi:hypothetical protein